MLVSKTAVLKEVLDRKTIQKNVKPIELGADFPAQNDFINDPARYIAAQCSRRAGKTNGLAIRFFKTMERHPKSQSIYLGLTLESARDILWPVLHEINDKYGLGCTFVDSKLVMTHPNGSKLRLYGADMKNFIKRLKGRKYPGVGIDEAQDFGTHLQSLVDDVLTPSIADYADGWIALTGTPGPVPAGYFFEVTQNGRYGYTRHKWTLRENPHMPNVASFLADLMLKREWNDDNPTLQREYNNKWVLDVESLWIRYKEAQNDFTTLPPEHKWNYILGVDLGYKDADAIAVVAWSETSPTTYLVEELIASKQGMTALVSQIDSLQKKYNAYKIVLDEGGLGKKIAEDIRQRFACPLQPADKVHKQDNVEFLNDAMRLGKFKAHKDSRFAKDSYLVQIDWEKTTPNRIVIKKNPHSDIIDAVLYAFRESYSYTHKPPGPSAPKWGSKEWAEQQSNEMFERELDAAQKEESYSKWLKGEFE